MRSMTYLRRRQTCRYLEPFPTSKHYLPRHEVAGKGNKTSCSATHDKPRPRQRCISIIYMIYIR